jgi:hypothetical protein
MDLRMQVLHQHYRKRSRDIAGLNPLMDERVILATSKAPVRDLASEEVFFRVLNRFSPTACVVPLYQNTWRFANKNTQGISGRKNPNRARSRRPHTNLALVVDVLNGMIEEGLPFDLKDYTPHSAFHGSRIDIRQVRALDGPRIEKIDFLWRIVSLAAIFNPKRVFQG